MSQGPEQRETGDIVRSFVLQVLGLFVAMLLPLAVLDAKQGAAGVVLILAVYVLATLNWEELPKDGAFRLKGRLRVLIAAPIVFASGFMAVTGVTLGILVAWLNVAYTPLEIDGWQVIPADGEILGGLPHVLTLLAGAVVFLALGVVLLHWGHGGLADLGGRLRRHGIGLVLAPWLNEAALLTLLTGGGVLAAVSVSLEDLVDTMSLGRAGGFLAVLDTFPFVGLHLASLSVLAVAWVHLIRDFSLFGDLVRVLRAEGEQPRRDGWLPTLAAITLAGAAAAVGAMLWTAHIGLLAAGGSVPATVAAKTVGDELGTWAIEMQEAGHGTDELVATVNASGFWRPEAPEGGLATLMSDLGGSFDQAGLRPGCEVVVSAAAATPDDAARPRPDIPHRQLSSPNPREADTPQNGMTASSPKEAGDEHDAASPLRYCARVTCPVPVAWDAPPAIALYSSHPSTRPDWMLNVYFDVFAGGVATAPGGYCTETGELADTYQG